MEEKLHTILINVLGVEADTIADSLSPENTASWDSFNGLMLVSELEEVFGVSFSMDEVVAVTCVGDIKCALRNHGIKI